MIKPRGETIARTIEQLYKRQDSDRGSYDAGDEYELDTENMTPGEWIDGLIVITMLYPEIAGNVLSDFLSPNAFTKIRRLLPKWREEPIDG